MLVVARLSKQATKSGTPNLDAKALPSNITGRRNWCQSDKPFHRRDYQSRRHRENRVSLEPVREIATICRHSLVRNGNSLVA